jgi:hypothetical protein
MGKELLIVGCFMVADWTLQAGEALRAGVPMREHLGTAEQPDERRVATEAVYRNRPGDLSDYLAARLGACLRERGSQAGDRFAKACYDQTLWAGSFFASRRRGESLDRLVEGYERMGLPLAALAEAVYRSQKPEPEFRRDLFLECLGG